MGNPKCESAVGLGRQKIGRGRNPREFDTIVPFGVAAIFSSTPFRVAGLLQPLKEFGCRFDDQGNVEAGIGC